jgi:putative membrane protein
MIRNFSDHAANERTFLAWIRTAIAIMAFGFLVAKFNLFLHLAQMSLRVHRPATMSAGGLGSAAGIVVTAAGLLIVILAAIRFLRLRQAIDNVEAINGGARLDLVLAGLMVILGFALVAFLSHTMITGI